MTAWRDCELCGGPYEVTHPLKRFCSERHQRIAERRRYRARRTEQATCKRCGGTFERTATSERKQLYCSLDCQYRARSGEYRERQDIRSNLLRARREAKS
jgi:hypothetical protein